VGGDLPTGEVDRLQSRLDLLHGLVAGQRPERVDVVLRVDLVPESLRATVCEGVLLPDPATQLHDVGGGVVAPDTRPAWIVLPVVFDEFGRDRFQHGDHSFVSPGASVAAALVRTTFPCVRTNS